MIFWGKRYPWRATLHGEEGKKHSWALLRRREFNKSQKLLEIIRTLTYHQATSFSTGTMVFHFGDHTNPLDADINRGRIYQWLSAPDPWSNYNKACIERQSRTGNWLMKSDFYADWKTSPTSIIQLYGIPGCGKTILSSTIIEDILCDCSHNHSLAVIYFYFDFNDVEKQQHKKMLSSLIIQLSFQSKDTLRDLILLFSSCRERARPPSFDELLATLQKIV